MAFVQKFISLAILFTITFLIIHTYTYWGKPLCDNGKHLNYNDSIILGVETGFYTVISCVIMYYIWKHLDGNEIKTE